MDERTNEFHGKTYRGRRSAFKMHLPFFSLSSLELQTSANSAERSPTDRESDSSYLHVSMARAAAILEMMCVLKPRADGGDTIIHLMFACLERGTRYCWELSWIDVVHKRVCVCTMRPFQGICLKAPSFSKWLRRANEDLGSDLFLWFLRVCGGFLGAEKRVSVRLGWC